MYSNNTEYVYLNQILYKNYTLDMIQKEHHISLNIHSLGKFLIIF